MTFISFILSFIFAICIVSVAAFRTPEGFQTEICPIFAPSRVPDTVKARTLMLPCLTSDRVTQSSEIMPIMRETMLMYYACSKRAGNVLLHYPGNYSLRTDEVVCGNRPMMSFSTPNRIEKHYVNPEWKFKCKDVAHGKSIIGICIFIKAIGNAVIVSAPVRESDLPDFYKHYNDSSKIAFHRTVLHYEVAEVEDFLVDRALKLFTNLNEQIVHLENLRVHLFAGQKFLKSCPFYLGQSSSQMAPSRFAR